MLQWCMCSSRPDSMMLFLFSRCHLQGFMWALLLPRSTRSFRLGGRPRLPPLSHALGLMSPVCLHEERPLGKMLFLEAISHPDTAGRPAQVTATSDLCRECCGLVTFSAPEMDIRKHYSHIGCEKETCHETHVFLKSPIILSRTRKNRCAEESNNQHFKAAPGVRFGSDFKRKKIRYVHFIRNQRVSGTPCKSKSVRRNMETVRKNNSLSF